MTILIVTGVTLVFLGYLVTRRQNSADAAIFTIAASSAGIALASFLAVRRIAGVIEEIARTGRALPEMSLGIWQASLLPMAAAAATAVLMAVALVLLFVRRDSATEQRSSRASWVAVVAVVCGAAAMLVFRDATAFSFGAMLSGSAHAIATRLLYASVGTAACFALAITLAIMTTRASARSSFRVAVVALVLTLGVSAAFAASLREYSGQYRSLYLYGGPALASR